MVERHYSLGKAAELLGVSKSTIRLWRRQGKIRFARLPSGHWRIPESEILRLLYGFKPEAKAKHLVNPIKTCEKALKPCKSL